MICTISFDESPAKSDIARQGEDLAVDTLLRKGYSIMERNYRFNRGEIDIIARDGRCVVFIEVKTRKNSLYGAPEYAITPSKRRQIVRVARGYIWRSGAVEFPCRFDVVTVIMGQHKPIVNHIINAFQD